MARGANHTTATVRQLIFQQGRATPHSVYQTIGHHEYNYNPNVPAQRQKQTPDS